MSESRSIPFVLTHESEVEWDDEGNRDNLAIIWQALVGWARE